MISDLLKDLNVDCNFTNAHNQPALCCGKHITMKGARAGRAEFIQWVSREDFRNLYSDPDVKFVGDVVPHLSNTPPVKNYTRDVLRGNREPEVFVNNTIDITPVIWR